MLCWALVEHARHEHMSDEYKNRYILIVSLKPPSWVNQTNTRSPHGSYRTDQDVQVNWTNMYRRSTTETIMHPIGQNILLIYPHFEIAFLENFLTPYREQPRSTRIVVAYPRPAISPTKRTNYAPISFDQQVQVSQGHTSYRNKESLNIGVHGGGGLELVKSVREPASSRPKPCSSLKSPTNLARSPLLRPPYKEKHRGQISAFPSETSRFVPLILAHRGSALPRLIDDRATLRLHRIWCVPIR